MDEVARLAEKLQWLFDNVPAGLDGQDRHTTASLVSVINEQGVTVTVAYVNYLRSGSRKNPSAVLLNAIAQAFGVSVEYFHDPHKELQTVRDLTTLSKLREAGLESVMFRASELSPESMRRVAEMIERLRREDQR